MVTLEEVKDHLRVTETDEDDLIQLYLNAATTAVADYCGVEFSDPVPVPVQAAVLLIVGDLFANREGRTTERLYANPTVRALLNPYRELDLS